MDMYIKIRKNLKNILPKNITFLPGRSLDKEQQQNFLVLVDLLLSKDLPDKDIIESFNYKSISYNDNHLITDNVNTVPVIRWYLEHRTEKVKIKNIPSTEAFVSIEINPQKIINIRKSSKDYKKIFRLDSNIYEKDYSDLINELKSFGIDVYEGYRVDHGGWSSYLYRCYYKGST